MPVPTELEITNIKAHAAQSANNWNNDWAVYFEEIRRLTGLTLQETMMFELVMTWRSVDSQTRENMKLVRKHLEDEHGEEPWRDTKNG